MAFISSSLMTKIEIKILIAGYIIRTPNQVSNTCLYILCKMLLKFPLLRCKIVVCGFYLP